MSDKKDALKVIVGDLKNKGEFQFRHPVYTNNQWRPVSFKRKSQKWWEEMLSFFRDSKILSIGTAIGSSVAGLTGNPAAGSALSAASSELASAGYSKHVVIKRPVPKARKAPAVRKYKKKLA